MNSNDNVSAVSRRDDFLVLACACTPARVLRVLPGEASGVFRSPRLEGKDREGAPGSNTRQA